MEKSKIEKINIAIDGVAGAGKGTYSKILSKLLNYNYLEAGLLYRILTNYFIENNITISDIENDFENIIKNIKIKVENKKYFVNDILIDNSKLRTPIINQNVGKFGQIPKFKNYIIDIQKKLVESSKGWILEGRNMAVDVAPNSELKIYVYANSKVRASRRKKQYESYDKIDLNSVILEIRNRDEIDFNHKKPLIRPKSAHKTYDSIVNTSIDNPRNNLAKFIGTLPFNIQKYLYQNKIEKIEKYILELEEKLN